MTPSHPIPATMAARGTGFTAKVDRFGKKRSNNSHRNGQLIRTTCDPTYTNYNAFWKQSVAKRNAPSNVNSVVCEMNSRRTSFDSVKEYCACTNPCKISWASRAELPWRSSRVYCHMFVKGGRGDFIRVCSLGGV